MVLGAWGCGAFGNDPGRTARDFRAALESEDFDGVFSDITFAIADWSPKRRFLGPFRDVCGVWEEAGVVGWWQREPQVGVSFCKPTSFSGV